MGLLGNAIRRGVSDAVGKAVGGAIKEAVSPVAEKYANAAAKKIDETAAAANQNMEAASQEIKNAGQEAKEAAQSADAAAKSAGFGNLEAALGSFAQSLEGYATEAAKNLKTCPACGETTSSDKKFCPSCGAKLPEQTLAEGAVCPQCGKQNDIGTKFCSECGTKLPAAEAEEKAAEEKDAAVLAKWNELLPQYPVWSCGGKEFEIKKYDGFIAFHVCFPDYTAAASAVEQYREVLKAGGFREAGQYPSKDSLYNKIDGVCYHVDTGHCFEADNERPSIYFAIDEPAGGFDYVKPAPAPEKKSSLFGLFK